MEANMGKTWLRCYGSFTAAVVKVGIWLDSFVEENGPKGFLVEVFPPLVEYC